MTADTFENGYSKISKMTAIDMAAIDIFKMAAVPFENDCSKIFEVAAIIFKYDCSGIWKWLPCHLNVW